MNRRQRIINNIVFGTMIVLTIGAILAAATAIFAAAIAVQGYLSK